MTVFKIWVAKIGTEIRRSTKILAVKQKLVEEGFSTFFLENEIASNGFRHKDCIYRLSKKMANVSESQKQNVLLV